MPQTHFWKDIQRCFRDSMRERFFPHQPHPNWIIELRFETGRFFLEYSQFLRVAAQLSGANWGRVVLVETAISIDAPSTRPADFLIHAVRSSLRLRSHRQYAHGRANQIDRYE